MFEFGQFFGEKFGKTTPKLINNTERIFKLKFTFVVHALDNNFLFVYTLFFFFFFCHSFAFWTILLFFILITNKHYFLHCL